MDFASQPTEGVCQTPVAAPPRAPKTTRAPGARKKRAVRGENGGLTVV